MVPPAPPAHVAPPVPLGYPGVPPVAGTPPPPPDLPSVASMGVPSPPRFPPSPPSPKLRNASTSAAAAATSDDYAVAVLHDVRRAAATATTERFAGLAGWLIGVAALAAEAEAAGPCPGWSANTLAPSPPLPPTSTSSTSPAFTKAVLDGPDPQPWGWRSRRRPIRHPRRWRRSERHIQTWARCRTGRPPVYEKINSRAAGLSVSRQPERPTAITPTSAATVTPRTPGNLLALRAVAHVARLAGRSARFQVRS